VSIIVTECTLVVEMSNNEGDLGFSDQGAAKAGPSMHEPVPENGLLEFAQYSAT
jgi:hypothetical protein